MALDSLNELSPGRAGDDSTSEKSSKRAYVRKFRVIMDSQFDTITEVLAALPGIGAAHPDDSKATCHKRRAQTHDKAKMIWLATVDYKRDGPSTDPLNDTVDHEWGTTASTEPFYKDKDGDAILNSAGDYYDEGIKDTVSRWGVTITQNVAFMPAWVSSYRDAVNSDAVVIDGYAVPIEVAKIASIKLGKIETRNDTEYRVFTLVINIKDATETWVREVLDRGMRCKDPADATKRIPCVTDDGRDVTKPVLLDGAGAQLANPAPANAVFRDHDLRNLKPFNILPLN